VVPEVKGVVVAGQMAPAPAVTGWGLDYLAGRLVEVSGAGGTASLTMVARVMVEAQRRREPVAWVTAQDSIFFPPDLVASGLDLAALPVVRVHKAFQVARVAETLLRSGGFAMVVLDLGAQRSMTLGVQTRLAGLARRYRAALVALTRKAGDRPSLGSLVAVRVECTRRSIATPPGGVVAARFAGELRVLRDKRGGAAAARRHIERLCGPEGLC
jgi:hypothetical protein